MWRFGPLCALVLTAAFNPVFSQPAAQAIRGFAPEDWKAQHEREERAKAIPESERLRIYMEHLSSKPHHAGSPASKAVAEYLAAQLKDWGLDVRTEEFDALMPYPTTRVLEMVSPVKFRAELKEPAVPEDPATAEAGQIPTYNAYSASGDVTAPLVYVNYGLPEDYTELKREGIDVKGKIVLVRYGRNWRGVKAKVAQENGALACLLYSDPRDDGYFQGDVYPKGPMRPAQGVQRGSVLDLALYPGDPLSPGWASEAGSKRLAITDAKTLLKIPVLPISYGDAKPLLDQLTGPVAPESWRGALPLTYHTGPGPAMVHLKLDFDWSSKPLHDVIATIPGTVDKDRWILYGNHHDAWVNGASDPASGAAALLETARTLSVLVKQGWKPKRTIVLALWDGEEFGLMGSTEWMEKHLAELRRSGAVYINTDNTGRGVFAAAGSHSLETFLGEVLRDVSEPNSSRSLLDEFRTRRARGGQEAAVEFRLAALGSGSDYVPFVDHAGIASLNVGFTGGDGGGYHSIYDTLQWFERFSDGELVWGKTLTQVLVTSILRLSDATVLPFEFNSVERAVRAYADDIQREAQRRPGLLDLRPIQMQLTRLDVASRAYDEQLALALRRSPAPPADQLLKLNEALQKAEGTLLLPDGLPGREWYEHQLYAPGLYTGYDAKTLPGVREAVEGQRYEEANRQARRVAQVIRALAGQLDEAARLLK